MFWLSMLIMSFLVPVLVFGLGIHWTKNGGPKEMNSRVGYKTSMSSKNIDTWRYAHILCGKIWRLIGPFMMAPSIMVMVSVKGHDTMTIGVCMMALVSLQAIFVLSFVIPVEFALKRRFDKDGKIRVYNT